MAKEMFQKPRAKAARIRVVHAILKRALSVVTILEIPGIEIALK